MTDGIIQQTFRKFRTEIFYYSNTTIDREIRRTEQELIEKIKQEIEFSDSQGSYISLKELIGDNQE